MILALFWEYVKICFFASLFFCLFMFGGIYAPLFIVFYMYYLIYRKIVCFNKDALDISDPGCSYNILDDILDKRF